MMSSDDFLFSGDRSSPETQKTFSGDAQTITVGNAVLPLKIIRSARRKKTISYTVIDDGGVFCVRVLAPAAISDEPVRRMLANNEAFLRKRLAALQKEAAEKPTDENVFSDGSALLYLGNRCPLRIVRASCGRRRKKPYAVLEKTNDSFKATVFYPETMSPAVPPLPGNPASFETASFESASVDPVYSEKALVRDAFVAYLKETGAVVFEARAAHYAGLYGSKLPSFPKSVSAGTYKRKWGCCYGDNRIRLNFLLMMAPPDIIDYVVVHELCHIRHKDHSKAFWDLVSVECPDYRLKRAWLKENTRRLNLP